MKGHIMDLSNQYPCASHLYTSPELLFITCAKFACCGSVQMVPRGKRERERERICVPQYQENAYQEKCVYLVEAELRE